MEDNSNFDNPSSEEKSVVRQLRDLVLEVNPEEIIIDAQAAGLAVSSVEDFRSLEGKYFLIEKLSKEYSRRASRWSAASGVSAGVGGPVTAITLGLGDLANVAAQLFRLSQKLAILHGFDPANSLQRERTQEIYYLALGLDAATVALVKKMAFEAAKRAGKPYATRSIMIRIIIVIAKAIGAKISTRQALKFVPIVGGAIGGGINYAFARVASRKMLSTFKDDYFDRWQATSG